MADVDLDGVQLLDVVDEGCGLEQSRRGARLRFTFALSCEPPPGWTAALSRRAHDRRRDCRPWTGIAVQRAPRGDDWQLVITGVLNADPGLADRLAEFVAVVNEDWRHLQPTEQEARAQERERERAQDRLATAIDGMRERLAGRGGA